MSALGLIIHHNIHLTSEQRRALHSGQDIETVGVSVAVWCRGKVTSEPAREIFCRYRLRNIGRDRPVKMLKDGFEICLPNKQPITSKMPDEIWRSLTPAEANEYYSIFQDGTSTLNLLDVKDGGSACLMYREHNKLRYEDGNIAIIHLIQIRDIGVLEESCACIQFAAKS